MGKGAERLDTSTHMGDDPGAPPLLLLPHVSLSLVGSCSPSHTPSADVIISFPVRDSTRRCWGRSWPGSPGRDSCWGPSVALRSSVTD